MMATTPERAAGPAVDARVRLCVQAPLPEPAAEIVLTPSQAHRLAHVMRRAEGDAVRLFNGSDGEWLARLVRLDRKQARVRLLQRLRPQAAEPGPVLLLALIKRDGLDLVVEKATELGCARLSPLMTARTVTQPPNPARLAAIATEAAEQCGRLTLPTIDAPRPLAAVTAAWPAARPLLLCTTAAGAPSIARVLAEGRPADPPPSILVGPEGGFGPSELDELLRLPFVVPVSLGSLTLRAETAAIAALACCRAFAAAAGAGPAVEGDAAQGAE